MKKFLLIYIILCFFNFSKAQDPNFSQFFASPLTLNPAMTGKFDGLARVAINYRDQWPTIDNAFRTGTISADFHLMKNRLSEIDRWGVGFLAFTDKSANGILRNTYMGVSTAYHKGLDENGYHQVGIGFQGTFVNKTLDINNVKFEDQLTPLGFTGATSEIFNSSKINVNYFDLNAGVFYNGTTDGFNNFYLGASMYHINRPKETFQGGEFFLNPRLTIQAGGKIAAGQYNSVHFSANHSMQANARNTVIGGAYALNLNSSDETPTNVYLGMWYRFGDAFIPYLGLEFSEWHVGFTYDVNTSGLQPASNLKGGPEVSLIYIKQPVDRSLKKLNCPKF